MSKVRPQFHVGILGAGFGGSLLATILQRHGLSVLLVDEQRHPRFAIGESSTPAADLLLDAIAKQFEIPELTPFCRYGTWRESHPEVSCGCKRGFSYFDHAQPSGFRATSSHDCEMLVAASRSAQVADTHWYRSDTDAWFTQLARQSGVAYRDATQVLQIQKRVESGWNLVTISDGEKAHLKCNFLIDASGAAGRLIREQNTTEIRNELRTNTSALFSHFEYVPSLDDWLNSHRAHANDFPYPPDDSAVHHLFDDGWLWQLRFNNGITSIGYVSPVELKDTNRPHFAGSASDPSAEWEFVLQRHPAICTLLNNAQLAQVPGKIIGIGRLQRLWPIGAGVDWAALPASIGFVDPLHSTGIAHTLSGVRRLADILLGTDSLKKTEQLLQYSEHIQEEINLIDLLVAGCYASLGTFDRFAAWCMVYFAAATQFEKNFGNLGLRYLCADNLHFTSLVQRLYSELFDHAQPIPTLRFCETIEHAMLPYNSVGLFQPMLPNMYHYTAADKPA